MAYFDFLIDNGNKKPKPIEYIYLLDMVWTPDKLESKPIERGTVVVDVQQKTNGGGYQFKNKETLEVLHSTYGWSLAENTEENRERIKIYDREYQIFQKHKREVDKLRNSIVTLKPIKKSSI